MFLDIPEASEPMTYDRTWARYQPFLRHRGYELRPRYQPDWQPSWRDKVDDVDAYGKFEDYWDIFQYAAIDAIRISDGVKVAIRRTEVLNSPEIPNLLYLTTPENRADSRNRTVPILDILILPDRAFIVMPMLMRIYDIPFRHLGEVTEAMEQIIQGIVFMHEKRVVHRDACIGNIMMDVSKMIPGGFHYVHWRTIDGLKRKTKWKERWSVRPNNYYFIDFETSIRYPPLKAPLENYMLPNQSLCGQDKTVPEYSDGSKFIDGFKIDIYQAGNAMRRMLLRYEDVTAFDALFSAMTCRDPLKRVSASEAHHLLNGIVEKWSEEDLSKRLWIKGTSRRRRFMIKHFHDWNVAESLPHWSAYDSMDKFL